MSAENTIEIDIVRPVNPAGVSFIKYLYGAVAARSRDVIEKYRREFTRLIQRLGLAIEDNIGTGSFITGRVVIVVSENGEPQRAKALNLKVWKVVKEVEEEIEVEVPR